MTTRETTLIDRDKLLDWLEDERDVCLQHDNYAEAREASYIRKHVMEMPAVKCSGYKRKELN
jgi:hypothetical protein